MGSTWVKRLAVVVCLALALFGCDDADGSGSVQQASSPRAPRSSTSSMGEDGTWTIFVYLCGSDLESSGGMAAMDMDEMASASTGDKVRYVVETGGASSWSNEVSDSQIQRYEICDGTTTLVDQEDNADMGDSATLTSFLRWGVETYPAQRMGLVLWDHGGGSISGVCFDENADYDSLLLKELDASLCSVRSEMTDSFEFVGFDACLMGTVETANLMAPHARYLVASEETEPGYGWDYKAIGDYLGQNPDSDGQALGKVICDSFYESCDQVGGADGATLSVVELDKVSDVMTTFDAYAKDLYDRGGSSADLGDVLRGIAGADNFGGNNRSEGYTNMVDLAGIVEAGEQDSGNAQAALDAISSAVVYKVNGSNHPSASGLSTYYPLQVQGSSELATFQDVCVSPYYLGLVNYVTHGYVDPQGTEGYDGQEVIDDYDNDWSGQDYEEGDDGTYTYDEDSSANSSLWDFLSNVDEEEGESSAITFSVEPHLDDQGTLSFTLDEDGLANASSVQAIVLMNRDDDMVCIGQTTDVIADWQTGEFSDDFDGTWFCLPDGQPLSSYLVEECDGYDLYTAPISLNGEERYLRFKWDYQTGTVEMLDTWEGIDEASGASGRLGRQLQEGDQVTPLYQTYTKDGDDDGLAAGDAYTFAQGDQVSFSRLYDGDYYYSFSVDDIYGNYLLTDPVLFSVEGDQVTFSAQ